MPFSNLSALFIDIDETIIRLKAGTKSDSLFGMLARAGTLLAGLSSDEVSCRIESVKASKKWWHWSDFIVALELNPKRFWDFAYENERHYLESTGPEIGGALEELRKAGVLLYVTSNNLQLPRFVGHA